MDTEKYNIAMPGRIVEYFPVDQTATVRISNDRTYSTSDASDLQTSKTREIQGVPVFTAGGGGYSLTFPIKAGDTCLLMFSQFGYDHWLYNDSDSAGVRFDGEPEEWTKRAFDLADGFCQVGYNTIPKAHTNYQDDGAEFRNSDRTARMKLLDTGDVEIGGAKVTTTASGIILNSSDVGINTLSPLIWFSGDVTMFTSLSMAGNTINNVANPAAPQDAMTKAYADANYAAASGSAASPAEVASSVQSGVADAVATMIPASGWVSRVSGTLTSKLKGCTVAWDTNHFVVTMDTALGHIDDLCITLGCNDSVFAGVSATYYKLSSSAFSIYVRQTSTEAILTAGVVSFTVTDLG